MTVTTTTTTDHAHVGDWLEVSGPPGSPTRHGLILEVLGHSRHLHFRVRWDEEHESLFYPAHGGAVVHPAATHRPPRRRVARPR